MKEQLCIDTRPEKPAKRNSVSVQVGDCAIVPADIPTETSSVCIQTELATTTGSTSRVGRSENDQDTSTKGTVPPRQEIQRRLSPKRDEDFALLHTELQEWRDCQQSQLVVSSDGDRAKMIQKEQEALSAEGYLLRKIDKLKVDEQKRRHSKRVDGFLSDMAEPDHWTLSNGECIEVHTPAIINTAKLKRLYYEIGEGVKERESHKKSLEEARAFVSRSKPQTPLSNELSDLISREIDLINRRIDVKHLNERVLCIFLQYIQNIAVSQQQSQQ